MCRGRAITLPAMLLAAATFACKSTTGTEAGVPSSILVTPDTLRLVSTQSRLLAVSVFDAEGSLLVGVPVTYESSDPTLATVSSLGLVTAIGTAGQATVTVKCGTASKAVPVFLVAPAPARVAVNPPSAGLAVGDSVQLTATVYDQLGRVLSGAAVTFSSGDPSLATVSATGLVRGVALGTTSITATSGAAHTSVPVQVQGPNSITANIPVAGGTYGIDVSSGGVIYATVLGARHVVHISLTTQTVVDTIGVGGTPTGVGFSPDGASAYVTNQGSGTLSVVKVAADSQVATVTLGNSPFVVLASPTGATVAATDNVGNLYFVNPSTDSVVATVAVGGAPNGLAFNQAGTRLYVSTSFGGTVVEVDPAAHTALRTIATGGTPQGIAVSGDGTTLYVANEAGWLGAWTIATAARLDSVPLSGGGFGLARSPDDSVLFVGIPQMGQVEIVQRASRQVVKTLLVNGSPRRIAFTADGHHAVVANEGGWVSVIAR